MKGAAKSLTSIKVSLPPQEFSVFITPSFLNIRGSNGSLTSPTISGSVISGVEPFIYEWSTDNPIFEILSQGEPSTRIRCSGFNAEIPGILTLKVTDNDANEVNDVARIIFGFGAI